MSNVFARRSRGVRGPSLPRLVELQALQTKRATRVETNRKKAKRRREAR